MRPDDPTTTQQPGLLPVSLFLWIVVSRDMKDMLNGFGIDDHQLFLLSRGINAEYQHKVQKNSHSKTTSYAPYRAVFLHPLEIKVANLILVTNIPLMTCK